MYYFENEAGPRLVLWQTEVKKRETHVSVAVVVMYVCVLLSV